MGQIIDINENKPHCTAELMCVNCLHRWIGVWPADTWLKDLLCPHCNHVGGVITTGQLLEEDYGDT